MSMRVKPYLDSLIGSRTPGLQYLLVDAERAVFEYAGGLANLRDRLPMTATTTMMAYSMSKTITAAAVLQLVESGQVRLEAPVSEYVAGVPYPKRITVRQLLAHTSGIPNPIPLRWVHPAAGHATFDEGAALARVLREHPRLAFEPGTRYAYSNIGYWLLGKVVERSSGQRFGAYVESRVLRPVGASPSELAYAVPNQSTHARGYLEKYSAMNLFKRLLISSEYIGAYEGRWLGIESHYLNGPSVGGLVGTASGFGKFLQDQLRPHSALFADSTRALFNEQQSTTGGKAVPMTLGWHVSDLRGVRYFYKEGGGGGFHSMMRLYPSLRRASVVMANATGIDVKGLLDRADASLALA